MKDGYLYYLICDLLIFVWVTGKSFMNGYASGIKCFGLVPLKKNSMTQKTVDFYFDHRVEPWSRLSIYLTMLQKNEHITYTKYTIHGHTPA